MNKNTFIKPAKSWQLPNLRELYQYKDLLYFLTLRSIKAKYAQSILGVGWAIIQPLLTAVVFTFVFGRFARINSNGIPYILFSYLALWPWNYFSGTLTESSISLVNNSQMINKVYFPRLLLPLSFIFSSLVDFSIAFIVVVLLVIHFKIGFSWQLFYLPLLMLQLLFSSLGLGLLFSSMAIQYRDIKHAMTFIIQLLLFVTPVVYSTGSVPVKWQFLYSINPMTGVVEGFRASFLGSPMPWQWIIPGGVFSGILLLFGLFYFQRMEYTFADVA